jgi:hypothetical protein
MLCCPPPIYGKKNLINFKHYDLANGKNECIRSGGHVDIEVSYKILWLEVLKESSILTPKGHCKPKRVFASLVRLL